MEMWFQSWSMQETHLWHMLPIYSMWLVRPLSVVICDELKKKGILELFHHLMIPLFSFMLSKFFPISPNLKKKISLKGSGRGRFVFISYAAPPPHLHLRLAWKRTPPPSPQSFAVGLRLRNLYNQPLGFPFHSTADSSTECNKPRPPFIYTQISTAVERKVSTN